MTGLFFSALGLVFVIEGLLPFLMPRLWRSAMLRATLQNDSAIRFFGLASMLLGLLLVYSFHHYG